MKNAQSLKYGKGECCEKIDCGFRYQGRMLGWGLDLCHAD